ncbi:MAG TPA: type II secretion system F family protein [Armatimonadota bacterium]|nr:type II secretion system F family protein [Armatimonadota bacterium]
MAIMWAAISFVGVLALVAIVTSMAGAGNRNTSARLQQLVTPAHHPTPDETEGSQDHMPTITKLLSGREINDRLATAIAAAGLRLRPGEFVGIVAFSVVFFQIIALAIGKQIILNATAAVIAIGIPIVVLKMLQNKRRAAFELQLVDALMMIASSLRSGFSFLRGMQVVAQEMPEPISQEFERVINEVGVGRGMEEALRNMVARMNSYDLDLVVTAILIQLQVGGNLAEMLEIIAGTIRERLRIYGEMRVLTAEGRLSGWVLVAIPVFLGVVLTIVNRSYMSFLFEEPLGHYFIAGAVILQIIGGLAIKRMLVLDA